MFWEGTTLEALDDADSRRFFPHALIATLAVIVLPALVVVRLSPLSGIPDLLVSALLATGLSIAAGSAGSLLWTRSPASREIPFGDLMLWAWARRVRAERRLAKLTANGTGGEQLDQERELGALRRLSVVFEARDGFSHGHSGRVARHAERIARRMGLSEAEIERVEAAAAVHDVGKVRLPRAVLAERSDRTDEDQLLLKAQAVAGARQIAAVADPEIADVVRHQYERVDGTGYPDGLAGDAIPVGARILAVANGFDELVSPGPQREPRSRRNALDVLGERAGSEFDAAVVAAFVAYYSGVRSIAGVAFAATAPQRLVRWVAAAPAGIGSAVGTPALVQGVCAAGTLAVAGSCLGGLPALTPERDGARPAAVEQRVERPAADGATAVADSDGGASQRDGGGKGEQQGGPDTPNRNGGEQHRDGRSGGGEGSAPTTPTTGGGDSQPVSGGGGNSGSGGAVPNPPSSPVQVPDVPAPTLPETPAAGALDPVLDGVGQAVPPLQPVTDAVKDVLGGLTGGAGK